MSVRTPAISLRRTGGGDHNVHSAAALAETTMTSPLRRTGGGNPSLLRRESPSVVTSVPASVGQRAERRAVPYRRNEHDMTPRPQIQERQPHCPMSYSAALKDVCRHLRNGDFCAIARKPCAHPWAVTL